MPPSGPMRLTFLAHSCAAAAAALAVLLEPGHESASLLLAGAPNTAPGEPERLAAIAAIPVTWAATTADAIAALRHDAPEVAVAACFPWRLPRAAREIPPLGILNIHPSRLPAGRGPEPIFWTLRRGEPQTGATVHRMDAGLDTGPIVAQVTMPVPEGIRAPALERELMALGARALIDALPALAAGDLQPEPQPSTGVSHAPVPCAADWLLSPLLPAAWAWRFARGVAPLGGPLAVIAGGAAIPIADALAWSPDERQPHPIIEEDDGTLRVRFSPGWVRFRLTRHVS